MRREWNNCLVLSIMGFRIFIGKSLPLGDLVESVKGNKGNSKGMSIDFPTISRSLFTNSELRKQFVFLKPIFCGFLNFVRPFTAHVNFSSLNKDHYNFQSWSIIDVLRFLEQFVRQLLKFYLYFSFGSDIKDKVKKASDFRHDIILTAETRLIFDKDICHRVFLFRYRMNRVCNLSRISATKNRRRAKDERVGRSTCGPSN